MNSTRSSAPPTPPRDQQPASSVLDGSARDTVAQANRLLRLAWEIREALDGSCAPPTEVAKGQQYGGSLGDFGEALNTLNSAEVVFIGIADLVRR